MEQLDLTAIKPRLVPRRLRWAGMISMCWGFSSGTTMGTSSVQRLAELLDTTGHSALAYRSSRALISSFFMSTAQKTKSTMPAIFSTSAWASITTRDLDSWGMGDFMAQRR